jgi:hypothetical protein
MKKTVAGVIVLCCSLAGSRLLAQGTRPDFSGTWRLNRGKSEFHRPAFLEPPGMSPPGGMAGGGMGGPGMGGPGGPGGGMGGPGMGGAGGGMGGSGGWGGPAGRPGMNAPGAGSAETGVADLVTIVHQEPRLEVSIPVRFGEEERTLRFEHTTDGRKNQLSLPGGVVVRSKTRWKKRRLVTESTWEGPMGGVTVIETRSLSEDGSTMTVEFTMRAGAMELRRKLVYERAACPPTR